MIDKQYVINNVSNIEKLPNVTILKMLMQFKEQLETSGAYHSITIGEVTTLEAEENAYVENVGTSTDLILNFGIPKGVGFNFSGEWVSDDNEYYPNDVVLYNGNLYICISTILDSETPPNIDTTHWSLFVGYGNAISEFVKSEYDKQLNLAPLENKVYSGSFSITWASFWVYLLQPFTLRAGTTYSWSAKIKSSNSCRMNQLGLTNNSQTIINLYDLGALTDEYVKVSKTFTPTTDIVVDNIYVHNATVGSVDIKEIMVVEGDLHDYQEWNGSIIHEKDIKPVLLWKFGQLNTAQTPSENLEMLSRKGYKYLTIRYQAYQGYQYVVKEFKIVNPTIDSTNDVCVIVDGIDSTTTYSRRIIFKNDGVFEIRAGYSGSTENNSVIIVQEILGSNY